MATQREYLVSLGLAKPGRGRFSTEAKAALAKAVEEGMTFTDTKEAPQASADASEHPRPRPQGEASPSVRKDGGVPLLIVGGSPTKLRNISSLKGLTVEGYRVGFDTCNRCLGPLTHCSCKKPKAPGIVVEILDLPDWTPVG